MQSADNTPQVASRFDSIGPDGDCDVSQDSRVASLLALLRTHTLSAKILGPLYLIAYTNNSTACSRELLTCNRPAGIHHAAGGSIAFCRISSDLAETLLS